MTNTLDYPFHRNALNRIAHCYDKHAGCHYEIIQRLLQHLEPMRLMPEKILDLGTRTGYGAHLLHKRYPKAFIVGVDMAEKMLQQVRRRRSRWWWRPMPLCADSRHLPLAEQSVDLVFAGLLPAMGDDIKLIFSEIRRVLRPEGLFLFAALGPDTLQELRQSWQQVDNNVHVHDFMDMHYWGDALVQAGLLDPVLERESLTVLYDNIQTLFQDLQGSGSQNHAAARVRHLTGKQRFHAFLQAYAGYRRADGAWPATLEIIYGHAWGAARAAAGGNTDVYISPAAIKILSR
jgi:malonyl-CoA O-methyltransferase